MTWERRRAWHLVRPLVYYLQEDLVAPHLASHRDVLDFSAGLGDLSEYLVASGARSVLATRPESDVPHSGERLEWVGGIAAGKIAASLPAASFDLAVARMVFQFPTWEGDRADPDTMVSEFAQVLRPGGRLVMAFHEFVSFEPVPSRGPVPGVDDLLAADDRGGLVDVIRYLALPPREGPFGETGFGLKVPMLVTTLQRHGFEIEIADYPEPFTMPRALHAWPDEELADLGRRAMDLKRRHLSDPTWGPYEQPAVVRSMLNELSGLYEFAAWPIVRIVARLPGS
jgi:SAM-dependent methyltransferase